MPTEEALNPLPALFHHCEKVYAGMDAEAIEIPNTDPPYKVYTGHLTKMFPKLMLPMPYYSKVTRALIEMDCVRQKRRGGGGSQSGWVLVRPPTRELWPLVNDKGGTSGPNKSATSQSLRDLNERVRRLEEALGL